MRVKYSELVPDKPLLGAGGWGVDEKAKVSADDTTPGYLNGKLIAAGAIVLTEGSGGGDETLAIGVSGGGLVWTKVHDDTPMVVNNGYIVSDEITLTLPATAIVGSIIRVTGLAAWYILQNVGPAIHFGNISTTVTIGFLHGLAGDAVELLCVVADTDWNILNVVGNIGYGYLL
jgi:hypothetical protein